MVSCCERALRTQYSGPKPSVAVVICSPALQACRLWKDIKACHAVSHLPVMHCRWIHAGLLLTGGGYPILHPGDRPHCTKLC